MAFKIILIINAFYLKSIKSYSYKAILGYMYVQWNDSNNLYNLDH